MIDRRTFLKSMAAITAGLSIKGCTWPQHKQTDSFGNYGWAACSGYTTPLEPHPEWEELRSDNRTETRKNCIPLLLDNLRK